MKNSFIILSLGLLISSCQTTTLKDSTEITVPASSSPSSKVAEYTTNVKSTPWEVGYQEILDRYTTSAGVNYGALKENDQQTILDVTNQIAQTKVQGSKNDKLAFYINAYNAWMIKKAIDAYPVDSLLETDSRIYKRDDIKVGGQVMSLDHLENEIIRKEFEDARIHFAINCASVGCPPLHDKVLTGKTLDQDLNTLTKTFLKTKGAMQNGSDLNVTKLFKWFKSDFTRDSPDGTVIGFIRQYKTITGTPKLSYQDYSWKLNEIK